MATQKWNAFRIAVVEQMLKKSPQGIERRAMITNFRVDASMLSPERDDLMCSNGPKMKEILSLYWLMNRVLV